MKTIAEQILDGLSRFYAAFQTRRVLKTMEEVNANTDAQNIPSALLLGELNNKLAGFEPVLNDAGEMIGYKTDRGADTVYPFSAKRDIVLGVSQGTLGGNMQQLAYTSVKAPCDGVLSYTFQQSSIQAYAKKNGVAFASLGTYSVDTGYGINGTLNVKKDDVISITTGSRAGHTNSVLFIGRYQ